MKKSPKWSVHLSRLTSITLVFLFISVISRGQSTINIVPEPAELKVDNGNFFINKDTKIVLEGDRLEKMAGILNDHLKKQFGLSLQVTKKESSSNKIVLNYERLDYEFAGAYTMDINSNQIYIAGDNEAGVFYGIQTLFQLLPLTKDRQLAVPELSINDHPRFEYRGMHLDVARHFFTVQQVKQYIDWMAAYKFNKFHWHLTEDQGWRIEIKKYPKLTSVGSNRNGTIKGRYPGTGNDSTRYGGFYTQQQIKEIVKYAADRYIDVIPEIEMPGHSSAAIAAYPQLSCFPNESTQVPSNTAWFGSRDGKQVQQSWGVFEDVLCPSEYTFRFLEDVLNEVIQLFPYQYIHIGGDESPKESWKRSSFCQQLIKEKKLKDEHELQSYFIQRIEKYINSKGKKIIGWDEILEGGLAPNATVMSWRGESGGIAAARLGHDVIMTPENPLYINHAQSKSEDSVTQGGFNPLEAVYNYDPVPKELNEKEAKHIWGAQGNMWSEYISNQHKLEYMLFPRMLALSEALWTVKEKKDWDAFEKRLPVIYQKLDAGKINYSKAFYDIKATASTSENYDAVKWKLETKNKDCRIIYMNPAMDNTSYDYSVPISITSSNTWSAALKNKEGKIVSNWLTQKFIFNKATGKKITLINQPSKNYPGNGAFTLVDGIRNEKGMGRSAEFLGFSGSDLEAVIDLGKETEFTDVTIHYFTENGSWIYAPASASFQVSYDAVDYSNPEKALLNAASIPGKRIVLSAPDLTSFKGRYIKVLVKNYGIIPTGNPGSGNPAWLFVDEIQVD